MEFLGKKPWKEIISVSFLCSNLNPGQYSIGITKTSNWVGYILYDTFRFPMRFNSYNGRRIYIRVYVYQNITNYQNRKFHVLWTFVLTSIFFLKFQFLICRASNYIYSEDDIFDLY